MQRSHFPLLTRLLLELFDEGSLPHVVSVDVEPTYGYAARIVYINGYVRMIRGGSFGINSNGASDIAKDKGYTKYFLQNLGYTTPPGRTFVTSHFKKNIDQRLSSHGMHISDSASDALSYIDSEVEYPCYLKPNDKSKGVGVYKCFSADEVRSVISQYESERVSVFLVEKAIGFPDYRVVVLRNRVISCYLRKPLEVIGNGAETIRDLLLYKQKTFVESGRDTVINVDDSRIFSVLARQGFSLDSIPRIGERVLLFDISNLSAGGDSEDYTSRIHPYWKDLCVRVSRDMGLVYCGVDLACADIESPDAPYSILELNSAPGLDNYVAEGEKQRALVKELYREVLNEMF